MSGKRILLIEPFYGGSHKQVIDLIYCLFPSISSIHTMPAKKWHWKALTSPLHLAQTIPKEHDFCVLFASSVLPLAEFTALRPDLARLHKIVYFHENQLVYPVQERKQRYFQHGYNDVLTCLVADKVLFNSYFNKESLLSNLSTFFNIMPDYRPKNLEDLIRPKCEILYFPIDIPKRNVRESGAVFQNCSEKRKEKLQEKLHIVWPHRWEHDKDPETFFSVIFRLKDSGEDFYLSVIGETYSEKPKIFEEAELRLRENIINWGYKESKTEYFQVLHSADVAVSTAVHEFFGVSMIEAAYFGCYPLCPKKLAYPEIYPDKYLYNTPNQLYKRLKYFCKNPLAARNHKNEVDFSKFSWETMKTQYMKIFTDCIN
ncbi:glycosyltransferase-like domain-containing protein 1 isoform X1 [Stegodyphus dumicola]|uniref:glycosyltransferase-like domain-containing protein 1 isoform X1 n=1 Tax=Stegodyphus dumicola TaxID=202533 RepID=UPI0015ABD0E4|nr:glycosyltransferase-like domain-containing protein 1 isoform X1 [Stegodyphus dumicola]